MRRSLSMFIFLLFITMTFVSINSVIAQDDDYSDDYGAEGYSEPMAEDELPDLEDPNPDPEFMEEVEPGEYDQSDDVTETDQYY